MKLPNVQQVQARMREMHSLATPMLALPNIGQAGAETMALANEALFTQATFSEPLTTFATGYVDPESNKEYLDFVSPEVEVGRRFEYKAGVNIEEFFYDATDDIRAIGANFKQIEYTGTTVLGKTLNKGLSYRIDRDQYPDQDITKVQNVITGRIMRRLWRNEAIRAAALISASATNVAKTWSSGTPDPDSDIRAMADLSQLALGIYPTRLLSAQDAWSSRFTGLGLSTNPALTVTRPMTTDQVAKSLGMNDGYTAKQMYQTSASTKTRLGAGKVYAFYAQQAADIEDASVLKRFFSPTESGPVRVYSQAEGEKFIVITVEHYSLLVATNTLGIRSLTIS